MYKNYIKRILDIILSGIAIIILCPLFWILTLLVKTKLGSPVIFRQNRPGKKDSDGQEQIFELVKFRTMTDEKDENGKLLPDEVRLTRFGRFLRSTSLDELPELYNILKGDMSIVGPRPLLVDYLPRYSKEQRRRHDVRPGFTGWAQVNGRNSISWEEKFNYDVWYVDNVSFFLDLKIVFKTISVVFKHEGISSNNSVTMEEFKGTDK